MGVRKNSRHNQSYLTNINHSKQKIMATTEMTPDELHALKHFFGNDLAAMKASDEANEIYSKKIKAIIAKDFGKNKI